MFILRCHRCEVVERRAKYELNKSVKRLHLVEGFLVAIKNMASVISIVRESPEADSAIERLESSFGISREQAVGVMGLTLRRLTSLEYQKLVDEESSLKAK
jgi:DNA gyrase subunit A